MPTHEIKEILNATFYTSDGKEITMLSTPMESIEMTAEHDSLDLSYKPKEFNASFNMSYLNDELLDELTGKNKKAKVVGRKLVQRRKHNKKRINKKWAKIYGYDLVLYVDWE